MKQDEALELWLKAEIPISRDSEGMARDAWHAAVKHTLAFVVSELHNDAWHEGLIRHETIVAISKMEP